MPGDVAGVAVGGVRLKLRDAGKELFTLNRVGLDHLILLRGKPSRLVENGVRDRDFPHIMEDGGQRNLGNIRRRNVTSQLSAGQKMVGDVMDAADMAAGFLAAELDGGGQSFDHSLVELDDLLRLTEQILPLVRHHPAQPPPGLKQLHHRLDPAQDHIGDHRLLDHIHHAQAVCLLHDLTAGLGGNQKDGDGLGKLQPGQALQHLQPVQAGHDHVQQHRAQPLGAVQDGRKPRGPILRLLNVVVGREDEGEQPPVDGVVVDDEHGVSHDRSLVCLWGDVHRKLLSGLVSGRDAPAYGLLPGTAQPASAFPPSTGSSVRSPEGDAEARTSAWRSSSSERRSKPSSALCRARRRAEILFR